MSDSRPSVHESAVSRTRGRRAWIIGGALLITSTVFGTVIQPSVSYIPGSGYLGAAIFSAALLMFAFGIPERAASRRDALWGQWP